MTPDEAKSELVKMFSGPPTPPGKDRFHHLQYIPVQRADGVIEFVRDPLDAEIKLAIAEAIEEIFGPEPAEEGL
jgi:hypothetical protein